MTDDEAPPDESTDSGSADSTGTARRDDQAPLSDLASSIDAGDRSTGAEDRSDHPGDRSADVDDQPAGRDEPPSDGSDPAADTFSAEERSQAEPLGDLAASVRDRSRADRTDDDDLFTEADVPEVDAEVIWEELDDEDEPTVDPAPTEPDARVVEKDAYCESCPYFSTPPDVACTHEGTDIVELVDVDQFRVVNCPKVRENERLEKL